jgi:succinate-acetate transporter protein
MSRTFFMKALPVRFSWFAVALIVTGTAMLLHRLHVIHINWHAIFWGVVALGGLYKLVAGFAAKERGRVFWGTVFLTAGGFALLNIYDVIDPEPGLAVSGFLIALGIAFLLMFVTTPRDWYVLVPALFFLLVGGAVLSVEMGYYDRWDVATVIGSYWPAGLILFGVALLLNRGRKAE